MSNGADISTDRAHSLETAQRVHEANAVTALLVNEQMKSARKQGWLEALCVALLVTLLFGVWTISERLEIVDVRLDILETLQ